MSNEGNRSQPRASSPPDQSILSERTGVPIAEERITSSLAPNASSRAGEADWYVIHTGREIGPFSLVELIAKAVAGEIDANDLVKETGGLWTKASNVDSLQQQFLLRMSKGEPTQGAPLQANQKTGGRVSPAAVVIFTVGAVLFLVAHGNELPGQIGSFLARCLGYGFFFGLAALCAWGRRTGMTVVASLFLAAAGFDVAGKIYEKMILESVVNGLPNNAANRPQTLTKLEKQLRNEMHQAKAWAIEFHPEAADEARDLMIRFETLRTDVGDRFRVELENVLGRIHKNSQLYPANSGMRVCPMDRFSEAVYFEENQGRIWVIAIKHNSGFGFLPPQFLSNRRFRGDPGVPQLQLRLGDYDEPIRLDPNNARAYYNRGCIRSSKKDYDRALQDFNEAIRLDPTEASFYYHRANVWYAKGHYDKAIEDFSESIRLKPEIATEAYHRRGEAWFEKRDYDKAIQDYTEALGRSPLSPMAAYCFCNRGMAWYYKKNYDLAIQDYTEAIRNNPKIADFYRHRGDAWYAKRHYDKAIQDYDETIRLDPENASAYDSRGDAWSEKKHYDKAIQDYTEAIRLSGPNARAPYCRRGLAWSSQNNYGKAIKDFNEAIRVDPTYARAYYFRGNAWLDIGEYDKAIQDYDEAIRLDPTFAAAYTGRKYARSLKNK